MTRPLLPFLFGFICGVLLEYQWSIVAHIDGDHFGRGGHLTLLVLYGVLLGLWYVLYRGHYARLSTVVLVVIALVIGMTRYVLTMYVPVHHISHFVEDERVTIEGMLYKPPEAGVTKFGKRQYFYVETTWLEQESFRYRVCGKIRITLTNPFFPRTETKTFAYGDTIRTRLRLHVPQNYADDGGFNYRDYLRRQGIYLIGDLRYARYIIKRPERQGNLMLAWIYTLRSRIIRVFDNYAASSSVQDPDEAIQVIKAMTLGTSGELSPEIKEKFRRSGMYHFLVVSGIHIGILVWIVHQLLHLLHIPLRYRSIFLTVILLSYAGLTGFHFPVLRAVIMALVLYFAIICNRIPDPLYSLAFSMGLILFIFPTALFEVSFQLTVAATASILWLYKSFRQFAWWDRFSQFPHLIKLPLVTMLMTLGAMLGIAPLLASYFQQIYPYSFLSNLLALPVISLLLPVSLFSGFVSLVVPGSVVSPVLFVNVALAKWFASLPDLFPKFDVPVPQPSWLMLAIYYIVVYGGFTLYQRKGK